MGPLGGSSNLSYPVRIVAMLNVSASIILIIAILLGHIFYSSYGPLRSQGPPKYWVRPFVLSSVLSAHVFLQVLTLSSAVPNNFIFGFIVEYTIDESCSLLRFFLASEVARNWSLVVLSMYTLFSIYKSSSLSGPLQLVSWIITCILVWVISAFSTFFVLTEDKQHSGTTCSIKLGTEIYTTFHKYAPSSCISVITLLVLSRGGKCARVCRLCFKQSRSHERSEHGKWVKDQRRTTLVFQIITSVGFIPVSFVGYQVLDIFYYWLFLLSALLLKDVRELLFTFLCYTFCSCCSRHSEGQDDKISKDEEMADLKRQNGTQGTESKGLEEENKHSCEVTERTDRTCQIESNEDGKDYDITTDGTEIASRTKELLEPDYRRHHARADTLNETVEPMDENKTVKEVTKLSQSADIVSDDFDSKVEHMNGQKASKLSMEQTQKESRIGRKSKGIFKEIRNIMKKRGRKKKKIQKSDNSTSDSSADEQEPTDIDDENEKLSDDTQNSERGDGLR